MIVGNPGGNLNANATLASIAVDNPAATKVFIRYGLDFCCNGQRSLTEACRELGLDPAAVARELEPARSEPADPARWGPRPLPELIDFIERRFHESLRSDLPVLLELARKVERVHADKPACPRGLTRHLEEVSDAVAAHLMKEEGILFPLIREGISAAALMPVKVMMAEHEDHGQSLRKTRSLTNGLEIPPEACGSWRALYQGLLQLETDLMEHIHLENNVLFPRAVVERAS